MSYTGQVNELSKYLESTDEARKARFARQADLLERMVPKGSSDSAGNRVETLVANLRAAK